MSGNEETHLPRKHICFHKNATAKKSNCFAFILVFHIQDLKFCSLVQEKHLNIYSAISVRQSKYILRSKYTLRSEVGLDLVYTSVYFDQRIETKGN